MKHAIEIVEAMYGTALLEYKYPWEDTATVTRIRTLGDVLRALRAAQRAEEV